MTFFIRISIILTTKIYTIWCIKSRGEFYGYFLLGAGFDGGTVSIILLAVVFIVIVTIFGLIKPAIKKSNFNNAKDNIRIGMTEDEMIRICGEPKNSIIVDDTTKVVLYSCGYERYIRGNIETREILAVIKDNEITSIIK